MQLFDLLRFTVQLIDFINNLLAPVEGFYRYQIRTRASAIRKLSVTTALHGAFGRFGGKSFKVQIFQQP